LDEKSRTREAILNKRDSIGPETRKAKDARIRERLFSLPDFQQAKVVFFFASFRSEVSTIDPIKETLRLPKRVVLPRVDRTIRALKLYEITDISELSPGYMGIPEPVVPAERERGIIDVDLVVMPGVAFDAAGNRLGYGGGYYDRLLALKKKDLPLVALAYEEQIVDFLPRESHDIEVQIIVTDKGVYQCGKH